MSAEHNLGGGTPGGPKSVDATGRLRSRAWFDNPANADMTALYIERYLNFGLSMEELQGGRPIIGIAQSGSDLVPCNRHHLVRAFDGLLQYYGHSDDDELVDRSARHVVARLRRDPGALS